MMLKDIDSVLELTDLRVLFSLCELQLEAVDLVLDGGEGLEVGRIIGVTGDLVEIFGNPVDRLCLIEVLTTMDKDQFAESFGRNELVGFVEEGLKVEPLEEVDLVVIFEADNV
jgi:hypothetical protein